MADAAERPDGSTQPADGLVVPRGDRLGSGVERGLVLGGGGVWFVAWQVGFLAALTRAGVDLTRADRTIGTSAGSLVASAVTSGRIGTFHAAISGLSRLPRLVAALAPAGDLHPSQLHALELFRDATEASPETVRRIGYAALAAQTPPERVMRRNVGVALAMRRWPSDSLWVTCVDAYTGERCAIRAEHDVPITAAVAASSAVPGIFPPQQILDRRCMDGGVSGSGTHVDLIDGARCALVVALTDGTDLPAAWGTVSPEGIQQEFAGLVASGTATRIITPEVTPPVNLMDPASVTDALAAGAEQAQAQAADLAEFWA